MDVYFDTEFSGLVQDAGLISIGFVTADGQSDFYAELVDTYSEKECSAFCKRCVLPLLEGGAYRMSLAKLQERLTTWLNELGPNVVLKSDSARDIDQLQKIFPSGLPTNCSAAVLSTICNLYRRIVNFNRRIHRYHGLRVHHALDDAKANRIILARF